MPLPFRYSPRESGLDDVINSKGFPVRHIGLGHYERNNNDDGMLRIAVIILSWD